MTKPAIDERALEAAHEAFITSSCSNISLKDNLCTVITAYLAALPADKPDAAALLTKAVGQVEYWRNKQALLPSLEHAVSEDGEHKPIGDEKAWGAGYANGRYSEADWWLTTIRAWDAQRGSCPALTAPPPSIPPKTEADYFGGLVLRARAAAAKASAKFPQPNYVTLKIAEEAGEVVRGAVHYAEGRMPWDEVEGEIVQLLAMLIRFVTEGDQINGVTPPASIASPPAAPDVEEELRQAKSAILTLLAEIDWMEEVTGEGPEDEDAALVAEIRAEYAPVALASPEGE